jgi:hypothetical protein
MLEAAGQHWQQAIEKLERQGPIKLQEEDQEMEEEKSRSAALMVQHQTRAAAVAKRNAQVCCESVLTDELQSLNQPIYCDFASCLGVLAGIN